MSMQTILMRNNFRNVRMQEREPWHVKKTFKKTRGNADREEEWLHPRIGCSWIGRILGLIYSRIGHSRIGRGTKYFAYEF